MDIGDNYGLDLSGWPVKVTIIATIGLALACPALLMVLLLVAVPVTLTAFACWGINEYGDDYFDSYYEWYQPAFWIMGGFDLLVLAAMMFKQLNIVVAIGLAGLLVGVFVVAVMDRREIKTFYQGDSQLELNICQLVGGLVANKIGWLLLMLVLPLLAKYDGFLHRLTGIVGINGQHLLMRFQESPQNWILSGLILLVSVLCLWLNFRLEDAENSYDDQLTQANMSSSAENKVRNGRVNFVDQNTDDNGFDISQAAYLMGSPDGSNNTESVKQDAEDKLLKSENNSSYNDDFLDDDPGDYDYDEEPVAEAPSRDRTRNYIPMAVIHQHNRARKLSSTLRNFDESRGLRGRPKAFRVRLLAKFDHRCQVCGKSVNQRQVKLHIDFKNLKMARKYQQLNLHHPNRIPEAALTVVCQHHRSSYFEAMDKAYHENYREFAQMQRQMASRKYLRDYITELSGGIKRCRSCGRTEDDYNADGSHLRFQLDHIKPVAKGGLTRVDNLQWLCQDCNSSKSDVTEQELIEMK